jgi:cyanate permease
MWRRYVAFLAIVIAGYGLAYARFGPLLHEIVQFSRLSTAAFGVITYLILVAPMCLFVPMALNAIRETTRSSALAHVGPLVSLPSS